MIHHVSISAKNPEHVADVLAELMGGRSFPFPGATPNSFIAVAGDAHGTIIEIYPESVILHPGEGDRPATSVNEVHEAGHGPFHMLMSVPLDREAVQRIGDREGWRTKLFGRGNPKEPPKFQVIEFWIENRVLVEVATDDMLPDYVKRMSYNALDERFPGRA